MEGWLAELHQVEAGLSASSAHLAVTHVRGLTTVTGNQGTLVTD